jgi:hypothetical protein
MKTKPGKQLQRMRESMLRQQDRVKLLELGARLKAARARRDAALKTTVQSCRRWRQQARSRVEALRAAELAKLAKDVEELRQAARNKCQARKHVIRHAGARAVDARKLVLLEERKLQAQLKRLAAHARIRKAKHATTGKERSAESDDYVRGNLPAELQPVFDRVKRKIKGGPRTTRTEAFLEWAAENPGDVLQHQEHVTDREVAELVREHTAVAGRLRKGKAAYKPLAAALDEAVPF